MTSFMIFFAGVAALIHVYFFYLESIAWTKPSTRKVFRMSESDAETTRLLAFNQGFYNLFLVIAVIAGFSLREHGKMLVDYAMASMIAAGVVLYFSKKNMLRGVLVQATAPAIYFVIQLIHELTSR